MHQIDGVCFLVFAERGLWNRFVPSLDGYIQDRLNNPVHVPGHGTVKALRLEAPPANLMQRIVEVRMKQVLEGTAESGLYPFTIEQVQQVARTEPTLRDMLQQFRHLFDHLVYGEVQKTTYDDMETAGKPVSPTIKSVTVVETPASAEEPRILKMHAPPPIPRPAAGAQVAEAWHIAVAAARNALTTEGSITGATRELQAGLGAFLQT